MNNLFIFLIPKCTTGLMTTQEIKDKLYYLNFCIVNIKKDSQKK